MRRRHRWKPPSPREPQRRATERVLADYGFYLRSVCGLAESSRGRLQREARGFLAWRWARRRRNGRQLGPADLRRYMAYRVHGLSAGSIRTLGACLRNFVRFLESRRRVTPGLAASVPVYAPWPKRPLAPALGERALHRFLSSWNRATAQGRRDYAMALCLAEMGLRAGEVAGLDLADLDWRAMTLRLPQTKQRRDRLLPLPPSVAKALVSYIQRGRPATPSRAVFVHHHVPKGRPLHTYDVSRVMRQALARGGIGEGSAHLLRHTLATRWHRQGVDLKAIADWLGHRDLDTTAEYALVDVSSLRQVALPWPQALR
ncbi:MAG: tyrosine-type recombinase/integrase [Verrucomicrobia bacterium]|nr:tyrosine-type recombinase/integrase [Verrucomicrobiota bacterium]